MVSAAGAGNQSGLGGWRGAVGPRMSKAQKHKAEWEVSDTVVCHCVHTRVQILRSRRVEGGFQMRAFKGPSVTSVTETLP